MQSTTKPAWIGVILAIAITSTMDATGYSMFSALPLLPLGVALWMWQRFSRVEMGLTWGRIGDYGLALLYPAAVLGGATLIAWLSGAVDTSGADWRKAGFNALMMGTTGILAILLTEEGFFRGWLWASLTRAGRQPWQLVVLSSLAFMLWHVSAVTLETGFNPPPGQVPIYLVNATLLGVNSGLLRAISGSVLVPSVSHAIWNGAAYSLFGFGKEVGALGIERTAVFGPEVGWVGVGLNLLFAGWLWQRSRGIARAERS